MEDMIFNKEKRMLNKLYCEIFGVVPCMQDFDCSREEYIDALKTAIDSKITIEKLLTTVGEPIDKNALI